MPALHYRAAVAACLSAVAGAALAEPAAVKFATSSTLMAGPTVDAGLAARQPLRGDLAEITGSPQKAYGTEVFPLRVVSGHCAGTNGWAGASRIEASTTVALVTGEALQFSSSDSLFKPLTPKTAKASCQPLRGDRAETLESSRFASTEGLPHHRVVWSLPKHNRLGRNCQPRSRYSSPGTVTPGFITLKG